MSGSGSNVGAQAGDSNPDMNRTTSAENNAKEKDGKVSTTSNNIYSNEAYFAHVISQCVQFVIVLSRDRNLGRVWLDSDTTNLGSQNLNLKNIRLK